jgi:hypothetical protein
MRTLRPECGEARGGRRRPNTMARLQCRAALGSSIVGILRAPYSRCWIGAAAKLLDISCRAIPPTRVAADSLGKARDRKLIAIDPPPLAVPSPFGWPQRGRAIVSRKPPSSRRDRSQIDRPGPRRGIRSPSSLRTDRYSRSRSHIRRAPCRLPSGRAFESRRRRPSE